ncbi:hypothetical protein D3C78_1284880 [compost metagenome]
MLVVALDVVGQPQAHVAADLACQHDRILAVGEAGEVRMGALLEALVHLMVGFQHRVAGLLHQALLEGVVGNRVVDQRLDDVLDLPDRLDGDRLIDLLQIVEDAFVLVIDDVDAGFKVCCPGDRERHFSSPLVA